MEAEFVSRLTSNGERQLQSGADGYGNVMRAANILSGERSNIRYTGKDFLLADR